MDFSFLDTKNIHIQDFTKPEIEYLLEQCNFSEEEERYFLLRSKEKSNVEISFAMYISEAKVSKLARKVKAKIIKVL